MGVRLNVREIADAEQIPRYFLEKILVELNRAGMVESRSGARGGHCLAKDPATITFGDVLRTVDGPVAPLPCLSRSAYRRCEDCRDEAACGIRDIFGQVLEAQLRVLDGTAIVAGLRGGSRQSFSSGPIVTKKSYQKSMNQRGARID